MANGRKYTSYFNADSSGFKKGTDQMVQALEKVNKKLVNNQYRQKECSKVISKCTERCGYCKTYPACFSTGLLKQVK